MRCLVIVAVLLVVSTSRGLAQQSLSVVVPRWAQVAQRDSLARSRVWSDSGYSRRATWIGVATGAVTGAIVGGFLAHYYVIGMCELPRDRCGGTQGAVIGGGAIGALAGSALGYLIGVMIDEERSANPRFGSMKGLHVLLR